MSAEHRAWRAAVIERDPWCVDPMRRHANALVPASHADHIVDVRHGGAWTLENGRGLCPSCHSAKTASEDGGFGNPRR